MTPGHIVHLVERKCSHDVDLYAKSLDLCPPCSTSDFKIRELLHLCLERVQGTFLCIQVVKFKKGVDLLLILMWQLDGLGD